MQILRNQLHKAGSAKARSGRECRASDPGSAKRREWIADSQKEEYRRLLAALNRLNMAISEERVQGTSSQDLQELMREVSEAANTSIFIHEFLRKTNVLGDIVATSQKLKQGGTFDDYHREYWKTVNQMLTQGQAWLDARSDEMSSSEKSYIQTSMELNDRLGEEQVLLQQLMRSLGLQDLSDGRKIELARLSRLRDFISSFPQPRFPGWEELALMYGEAIGLDRGSVLNEIPYGEPTTPTEFHGGVQPLPAANVGQQFLVMTSAGERTPALVDTDKGGSVFGHAFQDALAGAAADKLGIVTFSRIFEYVSFAIQRATQSQRPQMFGQGVQGDFPLVPTSASDAGKGNRRAILAFSDMVPGNESVMRITASMLETRGMFEVSTFFGQRLTRKAILQELRDINENAGSDDCLLFYFSGHGATSGVDSDSYSLIMTHSVSGDSYETSLPVRDLSNILKQSKNGTVLVVLDTSFAASAFQYFK